jgi:hypothetical protein
MLAENFTTEMSGADDRYDAAAETVEEDARLREMDEATLGVAKTLP